MKLSEKADLIPHLSHQSDREFGFSHRPHGRDHLPGPDFSERNPYPKTVTFTPEYKQPWVYGEAHRYTTSPSVTLACDLYHNCGIFHQVENKTEASHTSGRFPKYAPFYCPGLTRVPLEIPNQVQYSDQPAKLRYINCYHIRSHKKQP